MRCQLIVCCILALQTKPQGDRDQNLDLDEDTDADSEDQDQDADAEEAALEAIHLHGSGQEQVHTGNIETTWQDWGSVLPANDTYPLPDNTCCVKNCDPGCPEPPNYNGTWSSRGSHQRSSSSPQLKLVSFTPENARGENLNYCGEHFTCGPPLRPDLLSTDTDLEGYLKEYLQTNIEPASNHFGVFLRDCLQPKLAEHLKDRGGVRIDVGPTKSPLRITSKIKGKKIFPRQVQDYMRASVLVKSSDVAQDILTDILKMLVLKRDMCDNKNVSLPTDYGLEVVLVKDRLPRTVQNANQNNPGPLHNPVAIEQYRDINLVFKDRSSLALAEIQLKVSIDFHVLGITHALYEMESYLNTLKLARGEIFPDSADFDHFRKQLQTLQGKTFRVWYAAADSFLQNASNAELNAMDLLHKSNLGFGLNQTLNGFLDESKLLAKSIQAWFDPRMDVFQGMTPSRGGDAFAALSKIIEKFVSDSNAFGSYGEQVLSRSALMELQVDTASQTRALPPDLDLALWTAGDEQMHDSKQMKWRRLQPPSDYQANPITFFQVGLNRNDFSVYLPQATCNSAHRRVELEVKFKWKSGPDIFSGHKTSLDFFTESFEPAFMMNNDAISELASSIRNSSKPELQNFCCNSEVPVVVNLLGSTAMLVHAAESEVADRMYQQLLQFFQSLAEKCCSNPPEGRETRKEHTFGHDEVRWGLHTSGGTRFKIIHSKPWFRSAFTSLATQIFSDYASAATYPLAGSIASSISSPRTELVVLSDLTDPLREQMSWITNELEENGVYLCELSMRSPAQRLMETLTGHWQNGTVEKGWMTNLASRIGVSSARAETNTASGSSLAEIRHHRENSTSPRTTMKLAIKIMKDSQGPKRMLPTLIDHPAGDDASSDPEEVAMGEAFQTSVEKDVRNMLSMCIKNVGVPLDGTYVLSDALMFMAMAWDFKPLQIIPKLNLEAAIKNCTQAQLGSSCGSFEPSSCSSFISVHSGGEAPKEPCSCQMTLDRMKGSVDSLKFGLCTDQRMNQCNFGLISAMTVFSELLHTFEDAAKFILLPNKKQGKSSESLGLQDLGFFLRYSGLYDFDGRHVPEDISFKWLHAEDSLVSG